MPTLFDRLAGQQMFAAGRNGFLSEQVHTSTDCIGCTTFLSRGQGSTFACSKSVCMTEIS